MSQNPTALPNTGALPGLNLVNSLNAALDTLATCFSGAAAPASPVANQFWADTTSGLMKQRNSANTLWLVRSSLSSDNIELSFDYATDTGVANAYVVALNPAVSAYVNGQILRVKFTHACTGPSTINAGPGPVPLLNDVAGALAAGDAPAGGVASMVYDATAGSFLMTGLVPSQALSQAAASLLFASIANGVPPGTIIEFAGPTPPTGYLAIATSTINVSRTTYVALFAAIGTTWGAGDGSTTFGIPAVPAGYTLAQAALALQSIGVVLAHTHVIGGNYGGTAGSGGMVQSQASGPVSTQSQTPAGGAANLAASVGISYCIKY